MNTRFSRAANKGKKHYQGEQEEGDESMQGTPSSSTLMGRERRHLQEENEQLQLEILRRRNAKLLAELDVQEGAAAPTYAGEDVTEDLQGLHLQDNRPPKQQTTGKEPLRIVDFVDMDTITDDGTKRDPKTLITVSIAEWNVANIRIMYSLLEANKLRHCNDDYGQGGQGGTLDAYMVYTQKKSWNMPVNSHGGASSNTTRHFAISKHKDSSHGRMTISTW